MMASTPCSAISAATRRLIAGLADDERNRLGHGPVEAGRKIVQHDDGFAGIDERMNHVAADIAGAAGDQDRHDHGLVAPRAYPPLLSRLV